MRSAARRAAAARSARTEVPQLGALCQKLTPVRRHLPERHVPERLDCEQDDTPARADAAASPAAGERGAARSLGLAAAPDRRRRSTTLTHHLTPTFSSHSRIPQHFSGRSRSARHVSPTTSRLRMARVHQVTDAQQEQDPSSITTQAPKH